MTNREKIQLTDEMMDAITQTEYWASIQLHDPIIRQADEQWKKLLEGLPWHLRNSISNAACEVVSSYCDAAILYGIYISNALQYGAAHPADVSQYILDRIEKGRKSA